MFDSVLYRRLAKSYLALILSLMYVPMLIVALASISKSRFFVFPVRRYDMKWYENTFSSLQIHDGFLTSLTVAFCVALISVTLAVFGALAYARHDWRGKSLFQQIRASTSVELRSHSNYDPISLAWLCLGRLQFSHNWSGLHRLLP